MPKQYFRLVHDQARNGACQAIKSAPDGYIVVIDEPKRSLEANAAQWPYLEGFARQKELCINGQMQLVSSDDWKDVLTACWNGEMRMAAFDGRVIMMPQRTSKMGKRMFSEWMEYLVAMAAQSGVEPVYVSPRREQS
jgi:hypothetical protein